MSPYPGALNRADQVGKVMKAVALDPKITSAELATFLHLTQDELDKYEKARTYVSVLVVSLTVCDDILDRLAMLAVVCSMPSFELLEL